MHVYMRCHSEWRLPGDMELRRDLEGFNGANVMAGGCMRSSGGSKTAHQPVNVIKERGIKQKRTKVLAKGLRRKIESVSWQS